MKWISLLALGWAVVFAAETYLFESHNAKVTAFIGCCIFVVTAIICFFQKDRTKPKPREFWIVDYEDGINLLARRSKPTQETIGSNKLIKVREVDQ